MGYFADAHATGGRGLEAPPGIQKLDGGIKSPSYRVQNAPRTGS